jgi:hypothetical protein
MSLFSLFSFSLLLFIPPLLLFSTPSFLPVTLYFTLSFAFSPSLFFCFSIHFCPVSLFLINLLVFFFHLINIFLVFNFIFYIFILFHFFRTIWKRMQKTFFHQFKHGSLTSSSYVELTNHLKDVSTRTCICRCLRIRKIFRGKSFVVLNDTYTYIDIIIINDINLSISIIIVISCF